MGVIVILHEFCTKTWRHTSLLLLYGPFFPPRTTESSNIIVLNNYWYNEGDLLSHSHTGCMNYDAIVPLIALRYSYFSFQKWGARALFYGKRTRPLFSSSIDTLCGFLLLLLYGPFMRDGTTKEREKKRRGYSVEVLERDCVVERIEALS